MKKKLEFYFLRYFILIVVFFSLIGSTNFLKKVYFVNRDGYDRRIVKNYSFCKDESVAFLHFLKSKYKLNKRVKIVNYEIHPNSEWVFFNLKNKRSYGVNLDRVVIDKKLSFAFLEKDDVFPLILGYSEDQCRIGPDDHARLFERNQLVSIDGNSVAAFFHYLGSSRQPVSVEVFGGRKG